MLADNVLTSSTSAYTPAHAKAALLWLDKVKSADQWDLSLSEEQELLGGVAKRTLQNWKAKARAGEPVELSRDTMERLSLLLGIYKAYKIIAPMGRVSETVKWFTFPNKGRLFNGLSPKEYIIKRGNMDALYTVRRYLDAARG